MVHAAVERVVVQTSTADKRSFVAKAKRLGVPVSEPMRRGAFAYSPQENDEEMALLADAARQAVERSCAAIDDAMQFIEASNQRIAAMTVAAAAAATKFQPKKASAADAWA